jgi:hypothetical protein
MVRESSVRYWFAIIAIAATIALPGASHAASHALIMAIDAYEGPNPLPGVAFDVPLALEIAKRMGVAPENTVVRRNRELTLNGLRAAMKDLLDRVGPGDQVFVYYSGHGARITNPKAPSGCTEAMVAVNGDLLLDAEVADWVTALGKKSSRLVFMNDSCFSGGLVTRSRRTEFVPKVHKMRNSFDCELPTNDTKRFFRQPASALAGQPAQPSRAVYIAAASEEEVAFAGPKGSVGTIAWLACLDAGDASISTAEQLRRCAQTRIDRDTNFPSQSITIIGSGESPISLAPSRR